MRVAIRKHAGHVAAILGLMLVAAGVSAYILDHQRLRFPFLEPAPFKLAAEFSTAQAVTAGQGQTVRVSGVRIGDIADVELRNGRAVIEMDIDPGYADMIRSDATALLRPKTGLKDMFVELDPGSDEAPKVREGHTLPIAATTPDVNPDEIFSALDADTRDYLRLLVQGAGGGLANRSGDLADLLRRFEPTHRDLARVNTAVAERRHNLRRLVSSLSKLNGELAGKDAELAGLVDATATTMRAFASEQANVTDAVRELPSTLSETTDAMTKVGRFAEVLGPAAERLRPAARALDPANRAITPFARDATPLLREDIRPFVREARPLARELKPASEGLSSAAPALTKTLGHFNRLFNMAALNPNGREDPGNPARQEGYLFWAAWLQHMTVQLFSSADAHGTLRPVTLGATCATAQQLGQDQPELEFLTLLTPLLLSSPACEN